MSPFGLPYDLAILCGLVLLIFMVWYANRGGRAREE